MYKNFSVSLIHIDLTKTYQRYQEFLEREVYFVLVTLDTDMYRPKLIRIGLN